MGAGMATRLIHAGHEVAVFNRTASRAEPLVRAGARLAASPREACEGAEAVVAMTADDVASRALWLGEQGALAAGVAPQAFAIECSTLSQAWVGTLARAARERGMRYIDAPVTGLPPAAAAGELTLLVGADPRELEAARPLLDAFANRIFHFGPVGAGTSYKLVVNMIGTVQIASAAEGLALAERAGLDLTQVVDALAVSQAAAPQVVRNTRRMIERGFDRDVTFTSALRLKDVEYALALADSLGVGAPFAAAARAAYRRLVELGGGADHEARVIDVARDAEPR